MHKVIDFSVTHSFRKLKIVWEGINVRINEKLLGVTQQLENTAIKRNLKAQCLLKKGNKRNQNDIYMQFAFHKVTAHVYGIRVTFS